MIYTTRMPEPLTISNYNHHTPIDTPQKWHPRHEYSQRLTRLRGGGSSLEASQVDT